MILHTIQATTFAFDVVIAFVLSCYMHISLFIFGGYHPTTIFIPTVIILMNNCHSKEFVWFVTSLVMDYRSKRLDQKKKFSVDSDNNLILCICYI